MWLKACSWGGHDMWCYCALLGQCLQLTMMLVSAAYCHVQTWKIEITIYLGFSDLTSKPAVMECGGHVQTGGG